MDKTGYSRRILSRTIQSLENKGLIDVTNRKVQILESSTDRRGVNLFFGFSHVHFPAPTSALLGHEHVHSSALNKTNYTKLKETKLKERISDVKSVGEIIERMETT